MRIINPETTKKLERQLQNDALVVAFPIEKLIEDYGEDGEFMIKVQLPAVSNIDYPVSVPASEFERAEDKLNWTVDSRYTYYKGKLIVQLFYIVDDVVATDKPYIFDVPFSLVGPAFPPDFLTPWQDDIEQRLIRLESAKSVLSIERLGAYLFKATFDGLPEYKENGSVAFGACTSFVRDGKLFRNLDWRYDETATFWIKCKNFEGMSFNNAITDTGRLDFAKVAQLPYCICDGVNKHGIMVSTHVLFNDFSFAGSGRKDVALETIPFHILNEVDSLAEIHEVMDGYLDNIKVSEALVNAEYLIQFLVSDGTTTFAIIPPETASGTYEIVDATANPKLANFRWVEDATVVRADLQERPTGVERWNSITSTTELDDLRFTKAYETPTRLSEFIGIDGTTKDSTDAELEVIYDQAHEIYENRTRDGRLWQTVHSVVYSSAGIEHLYVQEDWTKDYIIHGGGGGGSETIDNHTLIRVSGVLKVNTTDEAVEDRTLPITSSGVYEIVGNIEVLLNRI